ncbi:hypothetical protein ACFYO9_06540 [Streptomyces sp. NPDC005863]|uniref:hypothetical protein n=1 Tax=unclassified Streptomyces TaxID=2593676 RepID=UPI003401C493
MSLLVGPTMRQTLSFGRDLGIELGQRPVPVLDESYSSSNSARRSAKDYSQTVPVVFIPWTSSRSTTRARRRPGEQTLTAELSNPDGDVLYCHQAARAEAEEERRQAAEQETRRQVCRRCGQKCTDQRWEKLTMHGAEGR